MKKKLAVFGAGALMVTSNLFASYDGSIVLTQGPLSYNNGGEFTAATSGLGTFQTFCLEYKEEFSPGNPYYYVENSGAVEGGDGAYATDPHTGLPMDTISIGTAWLYSQFRAGNLNITTAQQAGDVQAAIWYLENETTSLTFNGADGTSYFTEALTALGLNANPQFTSGSIFNDSDGAYGVIALNLYSSPNIGAGSLSQDQLAIVPETSSIVAGMLLFLPLGASVIRILRKKNTMT